MGETSVLSVPCVLMYRTLFGVFLVFFCTEEVSKAIYSSRLADNTGSILAFREIPVVSK